MYPNRGRIRLLGIDENENRFLPLNRRTILEVILHMPYAITDRMVPIRCALNFIRFRSA